MQSGVPSAPRVELFGISPNTLPPFNSGRGRFELSMDGGTVPPTPAEAERSRTRLVHEEKELQRAGLVAELVKALDHGHVEYRHWGCNSPWVDSPSEEGDFDLHVDRESLPDALSILANLGFKPAVVRRGSGTQGTSHHYGLDPQSGKITHVHVCTRLLTGERRARLGRLPAYLQRLWVQGQGRLEGVGNNRSLQSGGAVIAFVGGDATGKSTLVLETARWLARVFAVRAVHAGKPPASWLTAPVRIAWSLYRLLPPRRRAPLVGGSGDAPTREHLSLFRALKATTLAWDRRRLLIWAWRRAGKGDIVICDRYPSDAIGAADSPRLRAESRRKGLRVALHNWLTRVEHRLYAQVPPPDMVVRLAVSLETAKQRNLNRPNPDEHLYLEARHRGAGTWSRSGTRDVHDIDTEGSLEETMLRVRKAIWQSL